MKREKYVKRGMHTINLFRYFLLFLSLTAIFQRSRTIKAILVEALKYGPQREKTCLLGLANTGADQPAHLHSLISAFVIHVLESTISKFATFLARLFS